MTKIEMPIDGANEEKTPIKLTSESLKTNSLYKILVWKYSVHTTLGGGNLSGP